MRRFILAENWFKVKDKLEDYSLKQNHISYEQFTELCNESEINSMEVQDILLMLLHDLGLVIHFKELTELQTQVLNPSWITEGIYTLINSDLLAKQHGIINKSQAIQILEEKFQGDSYRHKT